MKKILIVCPSAGKLSDTPCGKDMYNFAKHMAGMLNIQVEILTTLKGEQKDYLCEKVKIHTIETYKDILNHVATQYQCESQFVKRIFLRIKLFFAQRRAIKHNYARYVMCFSEFKKWVAAQEENYDLVISVSHPFFVHKLGKYVFDKLKIKKWIVYFLDPYADNNEVKQRELKKRIIEEKKVFEKSSYVFCTEEFVNQRQNSLIGNYLDKVRLVPTHLLQDHTQPVDLEKKNEIHCVFTGMFYDSIRNPQKLLEAFLCLPDNYYLHLYCKGCQEILELYKKRLGDRLSISNYITDQDEYSEMMKRMDVFVNIGNAIANQVPSKILNYFSFGKPILHFKNCDLDPVEIRYSIYPLMKVVDYREEVNVIAEQIRACNDEIVGKTLGFDTIQELFLDSTMEKVCEQVLEVMNS